MELWDKDRFLTELYYFNYTWRSGSSSSTLHFTIFNLIHTKTVGKHGNEVVYDIGKDVRPVVAYFSS
ncbi:hypothetical protein P8452_49753 [Trifolium repens]|nr:hypothetical protein P8452_49753 [Trifolium repens]